MEDGERKMENGDGEGEWREGTLSSQITRSDMHDLTTALKSASPNHRELVMMRSGCMDRRLWFVKTELVGMVWSVGCLRRVSDLYFSGVDWHGEKETAVGSRVGFIDIVDPARLSFIDLP